MILDIEKLLQSMTLREKLAQMTQFDAGFVSQTGSENFTGPLHDMHIAPEDLACCGTVLNCTNAADAARLQQMHMQWDAHHIPLIFMFDVIHGFRTIFPIPLAMGCVFDEQVMVDYARVAAAEARASGIQVTFAPMLDLSRDARWGRVMESTGEDPWLNARLAAAIVKGFQGEDLTENDRLVACVKHFAAYGGAEAGRDYNTVEMGDYMLREFYLTAYKAAIDAGAAMVMPSFNSLNGVPSTANVPLLRGILREEFGFDGVTVSDWGAVLELMAHGCAADVSEAAEKALRAGVDIEMMTTAYLRAGEKLVADGVIDEALVDEAVRRILRLKEALGLFDDPAGGASPEREQALHLCPAHREAARRIAARSLVLLKNEAHTLPLKSGQKVAVIGPYATADNLLGNWGAMGLASEGITLRQGLLDAGVDATFTRGCDFLDDTDIDEAAALAAARDADVVVLALGETATMSGECGSRAFIDLPPVQQRLAAAVRAAGKPVVLLLFSGRPMDLHVTEGCADAILACWFPGTEAGHAIADVLCGAVPPEGRLAMSFPYTAGQCPVYYNGFSTGRPAQRKGEKPVGFTSRYIDIPNEPLYCFGYGLNYSPVRYGDTVLHEGLTFTATVTNEGDLPAVETAQLYVRDVSGSVVRPVRELRGVCKLHLAPGQTGEAVFTLCEDDLAFFHADGQKYAEPGEFVAYIGANCEDDLRQVRFAL